MKATRFFATAATTVIVAGTMLTFSAGSASANECDKGSGYSESLQPGPSCSAPAPTPKPTPTPEPVKPQETPAPQPKPEPAPQPQYTPPAPAPQPQYTPDAPTARPFTPAPRKEIKRTVKLSSKAFCVMKVVVTNKGNAAGVFTVNGKRHTVGAHSTKTVEVRTQAAKIKVVGKGLKKTYVNECRPCVVSKATATPSDVTPDNARSALPTSVNSGVGGIFSGWSGWQIAGGMGLAGLLGFALGRRRKNTGETSQVESTPAEPVTAS